MIDSWNAAQLNERIDQVEKKIQSNDVIANPTGEATADLSKISIDGTVYSILPVPEDPTELYFDGTEWITKTLIWENEDVTLSFTGLSDLDLDGYSYIDIEYLVNTSDPSIRRVTIPVQELNNIVAIDYNSASGTADPFTFTINYFSRSITITSESVASIGACTRKKIENNSYTSAQANGALIVSKIYAY